MMDNNRKTLNKREILMGHAYVFLFFFLTTVACCLAIFMWNSDFRMFEQKEFVKIKMDRIKDFQQEQAESQMPVDSLFRKIEAFQPGVYAQYEEDDIHYLINNLRNTYERNSWDKRYKLFMHIADFMPCGCRTRNSCGASNKTYACSKPIWRSARSACGRKRKTCARELKTNDAMGKIRTRKILFVVAAMLLCVLVAVLIRLFFSNRIVRMTLTPIEVEVGEAVHYADSTRNASSWLWEFGNGDVSHERSGQYVFKEPGRYQVRLQVDHSLEKKQIVKVNRRANNYGSDQLVKIEAPATAFQGEIISFKGYGPSREWRWQFGESGIVDSREQNPLYAYSEPGRYEVLLTTEETQYPVRHTIEVLPQYAENDSTDVLVVIGNDIREHLQAIVDGKPFNVHYNYILKKYLCGNPDIAVTVNNNKKNDFYSYCQGLKIIARRKTLIDEVFVDMGDNLNNECVMQLMVTQHERFSESKK